MIDDVYKNKFASPSENAPPARDTIILGRKSDKQAIERKEE